jgi:DNA-binding HxlR family transcriptional regulator
MEEVISTISKSKAIDIIFLLRDKGELRYSEIKQLGHYTTVSRRLKELEKLGVLERKVKDEYPPKVTYKLTEKGGKLIRILNKLDDVF